MKLRDLLAGIHYGDLTEEQLLDLEVKVVSPSSTGQYTVNCGIKNVTVKQEMRLGETQRRMIPAEKNGLPYILLETTMVP